MTKKEKQAAYDKKYYAANRDAIIARNREYYAKHKEERAAYAKKRYEANRDAISARVREWRKKNPDYHRSYNDANKEKMSAQQAAWADNNKDRKNAASAVRRARRKQACPAWVRVNAIAAFYTKAQRLQEETGVVYHVDHIMPLYGVDRATGEHISCGLRVPWNLQVITATANLSKGCYIETP